MKKNKTTILSIVIAAIVIACVMNSLAERTPRVENIQTQNLQKKTRKKHFPSNCEQAGAYITEDILTLENLLPESKEKYKTYDHKYFVLGYANEHRQPAWVGWLITKDRVENRATEKLNNFRPDSSLQCCQSLNSDYKRSGYSRGHICPSGDMVWSAKANSETFLLSNMSPQNQKFNAGRWADLERRCRTWATINDSILIISGPVFNNPIGNIGENNVTVPSEYYKIVIDISYPKCKAIAFIMPNKEIKESVFSFSTTIKEVEKRTHLNFFPKYNNSKLINLLETSCDTLDWK